MSAGRLTATAAAIAGQFADVRRLWCEGDIMKTAILILAAAIALTGCNTVQGMGKDIKKGGEAIEKAAK